MIKVDQFVDVKALHAQGHSIGQIVKLTGLARNTVRRIVRGEHPIETGDKAKSQDRSSKLDPFKDYIKNQVQQYDLSAVRILTDIRKLGYNGGVHTIRRYIRELKGDSRRQAVATVRFETAPGQQAQCDWGHVGKFEAASGKPVDIYVFVIVLSFSRMMYIRFSTSMKIPALIEGHLLAFEAWRGVPRTILYDNMAQVRTGPGKLNTTFADFAAHHGFEVKTHRPYRPRTKGKVERSVDYIKGNFLNGRSFDGLEDLNRQGERWLAEVANVRLHATTGERPLDLWKQEKGAFTPLDIARPYVASRRVERKVSVDTLVAFENSRYSVPPQYIGKTVEIASSGGKITIHRDSLIIAEHQEAASGGQTVTAEEHLAELWRVTLDRVPLHGQRHCNVRLDDSVQEQPLSGYEEVVQ